MTLDLTALEFYEEVPGKLGPHDVVWRVSPLQPHQIEDMATALRIAAGILIDSVKDAKPNPTEAARMHQMYDKLSCAAVTGMRAADDSQWQRVSLVPTESQHKPKNGRIWVGFLGAVTRGKIFAAASKKSFVEAASLMRGRFPSEDAPTPEPNGGQVQDPAAPDTGSDSPTDEPSSQAVG